MDHNKLWEILQEMEYQTTLSASWEICIQVKKQQLELDMEKQTGSKLEKKYIKAVYCHHACMSTSCKMPGWGKAEISIATRNINNLRYADDITLMQMSHF